LIEEDASNLVGLKIPANIAEILSAFNTVFVFFKNSLLFYFPKKCLPPAMFSAKFFLPDIFENNLLQGSFLNTNPLPLRTILKKAIRKSQFGIQYGTASICKKEDSPR